MNKQLEKEYEDWVEYKSMSYNQLFNGKITTKEYLDRLEKYRVHDSKRKGKV